MDNDIPDFYQEKDVFGLDKPTIDVGDKIALSQSLPTDNKPADLNVTYATLGRRVVAYLIDVAIVIFPLIIIEGVSLGPEYASSENSFKRSLIDLFVWTSYYGFMESSEYQATFGKKICGIMVIDNYGNRLTFKKAALRYLAQIISILPLGFGIWAIANDEKKQGWHDALLDCFVIKGKPTNLDKKTIDE